MPILHHRFEGRTHEGQAVPPSLGLLQFGLRTPVLVGVHTSVEESLAKANNPVPTPVRGLAILDTGATITSIDLDTANKLGLAPTGTVKLGTAGGQHDAPTYAFSFAVPTFGRMDSPQGVGCNLAGQGIIALIGMDLLSRCVLVVNGPDGSFTLAH